MKNIFKLVRCLFSGANKIRHGIMVILIQLVIFNFKSKTKSKPALTREHIFFTGINKFTK